MAVCISSWCMRLELILHLEKLHFPIPKIMIWSNTSMVSTNSSIIARNYALSVLFIICCAAAILYELTRVLFPLTGT